MLPSPAKRVTEVRLQLLRRNQEQRIAAEFSEEREALLHSNQEQRIAAEFSEEGEARLQPLRHNQQQWIASDTRHDGRHCRYEHLFHLCYTL